MSDPADRRGDGSVLKPVRPLLGLLGANLVFLGFVVGLVAAGLLLGC